jgi:hypothetical protein
MGINLCSHGRCDGLFVTSRSRTTSTVDLTVDPFTDTTITTTTTLVVFVG